MRRSIMGPITLAVVGCLALPGVAAADDGWSLRLTGVWADPDGQRRITGGDGENIHVSTDSTLGAGLSIEYGFSDRLGLEIGYATGFNSKFHVVIEDPASSLSIRARDDLGFDVLDASLDIRVVSGERVEVYAGPVVAQFFLDDLHFQVMGDTARIGIGDEFGYGLVLGADVDLGDSGWFFTGRVKYLLVEITATDKDDPTDPGTKIHFDPLTVGVGFGVRL